MKVGIFFGGPTDVERQVDGIVGYERDGFDSVYLGTVAGTDAMTGLARAGQFTWENSARIALSVYQSVI